MGRKTRDALASAVLSAAGVVADLEWGPHARLGPGCRLREVELFTPDAFTMHSTEFIGKVVLLDFFASW